MFKKILIANRGEIAVRIITTCHEMGIRCVAIYSTVDAHASHVLLADEAYPIGPAPATESYLSIPAIIAVARQCGAEAIHPGYGFLSENADFAEACIEAGLVFIGPSPQVLRLMGSKIAAKNLARTIGAPLVPGYNGEEQDSKTLYQQACAIGFPLLIKASAGGGGKGMRIVTEAEQFYEQLAGAQREAQAAFGDATIFLERYLQQPRHIEFQILADNYGKVIHLNERECSIQRRHQKILEESPGAALTPELREQMGQTAIAIASAAHYTNAGTIEFIVDQQQNFYFLEMNTRLQVEHPVTEMITGLDLVRQQLLIAAGEPLILEQSALQPRGHAIEVRIYAEDPAQQYLPSTGTITLFEIPHTPGIRLDSGTKAGDEVTQYYDPMLAKLIAYGEDRTACITRLQQTLGHSAILGVTTNLPLLYAISQHPDFLNAETYTNFLEQHQLLDNIQPSTPPPEHIWYLAVLAAFTYGKPDAGTPWQASGPWRTTGGGYRFTYRYQEDEYRITLQPDLTRTATWRISINDQRPRHVTLLDQQHRPAFQILTIESEGQHFSAYVSITTESVTIVSNGIYYQLRRRQPPDVTSTAHSNQNIRHQEMLKAPMTGTVVKICAHNGDTVKAHQVLLVLSAMKMEHSITAPYAGMVQGMHYEEGAIIQGGSTVAEIIDLPIEEEPTRS